MRFSLRSRALITFACMIATLTLAPDAWAQWGQNRRFEPSADGLVFFYALGGLIAGAAAAFAIFGWRLIASSVPARWIAFGVIAVVVLIGETASDYIVINGSMFIAPIAGFLFGVIAVAGMLSTTGDRLSVIFGSSRWATENDLEGWRLTGAFKAGDGLFLGRSTEKGTDLVYRGDMHALTVAPTRSGKGATAIIPNLLSLKSSVLVIDPKGENARRTAARRKAMGHDVRIVDPWGISTEADRFGPGAEPALVCGYNPLDSLDPASPDLATDAMMLADALIVPSGGDNRFWDEEAKGLIFGFLLYLVTDQREKAQCHLGRLRQILTLPMQSEPPEEGSEDADDESIFEILVRMQHSEHELVRAAAARFLSKNDREGPSVLSSAQSNTHFLDSPMLRENLSRSDFSFESLKTGEKPVAVYLVLPLDRLPTFNRWLRLLVVSALKDLMRIPQPEGRQPVRVILDEFAALKRLEMVREAYGTMAGLGVQLWAITQDLGQLEELYGQSWQSFVGNAGAFQYFGSRDKTTAEYASSLTGLTTVRKRSASYSSGSSTGQGGGSSSSGESVSYDDVQRPLAFPDELMTLPRNRQLIFIENRFPIVAAKVNWYEDGVMRALQQGQEPRAVPASTPAAEPVEVQRSRSKGPVAAEADQSIEEVKAQLGKLFARGRSGIEKLRQDRKPPEG